MNVPELTRLTDTHGTDMTAWPASRRRAAERLLTTDPAAAAAFARARKLDALLRRAAEAANQSSLRPKAGAFGRALPTQKHRWLGRWWPAEFLDLDFGPAWSRLAALAAVAALGFAIGLTDIVPSLTVQLTANEPSLNSAVDLGAMVIEADPLPGVRPL